MCCPPRLGSYQMRIQLVGEPSDDFVLHVEEVGNRLIKAFGPEMVAVSASMSWTLTRSRLPER